MCTYVHTRLYLCIYIQKYKCNFAHFFNFRLGKSFLHGNTSIYNLFLTLDQTLATKIRIIGTENADSRYCTIFRALQQKLILRSYRVRKEAFEDISKYRLTGTIAQTKGNSRFAAIFRRWRFSAFQNYK